MDRVSKSLLKIPAKQRRAVLLTSKNIRNGDFSNLDVKKLKNTKGLFRVRVGGYRIIYQSIPGQNPIIIGITKRDEQTYKQL